jgi:hypothetical protein
MLVALMVASVPWWRAFASYRGIVLTMAASILGSYWVFQFRIMQSAVHLAKHDWQMDAPDALTGTVSQRALFFAQVRAVLQHHRRFIVLNSLALLSLSLTITVYLYFWTPGMDRGILRYVGVVTSGYSLQYSGLPGFPFSEWPVSILLAGTMLLIFTVTNSLLSTSLGLWAGRLALTVRWRLLLLVMIFGMFLGLYALRETPDWTCHRSLMIPTQCSEVLFQMRVVDSFQAILLTFVDGGASLVTGIHLPTGTDPEWEGYQWRHLLAGSVTFMCQLAVSGYFLWLSSLSHRKKRIIWLFGIYQGKYYIWRYR